MSLEIEVDEAQLDEEQIRDLIALFYRYGVNLETLQVLCTPENENWLKANKKAFWHKKMWGKKS